MKRIPAIITIVLFVIVCYASAKSEVRKPVVAGTFYPGDSASLANMVAEHLTNVSNLPQIDGQLIALIVPHAGLVYSGQIAAYGYKLLENSDVKTVVLCGPSHRVGFEGISVYGPGVTWQTPLGDIACDDSLCRRLIDFSKDISVIEEAHSAEHCLEVQLPYLQTVLNDFRIVPVLMGYPDHKTTALAAEALADLYTDENMIMVASTDWQHYRPTSEGWKLDSAGIACIEQLDADKLEAYITSRKTEACGGAAAVAVMRAAIAKGANRAKILKYGDSGDMSGDKSSVVGYVAAALYKASGTVDGKATSNSSPEYVLPDSDRQTLLTIARQSISNYLAGTPLPEFKVSEKIREDGAAFVTLTKYGSLRGCIGYTMAFQPLYKTVSDCAIKAAVEDPRFPPVTADELPSLHIEISVLTPLLRVKSLDEIKVGRDGLMITLGQRRGLLLPQVATDYRWTETEFLQQTCRKAGLPPDAYLSPDAVIERFQALIFEEDE